MSNVLSARLYRVALTVMGIALGLQCQPLAADKLTLEAVYGSPSLAGSPPQRLALSPDGKFVTYIRSRDDDRDRYDLWAYDAQTGKTRQLFNADDLDIDDVELSDEEKARQERQRFRGSGVLSYTWSEDSTALLFPMGGDVFYWQLGAKEARRLLATEAFETDITLSPDGSHIAFIRDQNLWVKPIAGGAETALTTDGGGLIKNGMAEFIAQEEMDRMTGYWWSPDSAKIAFLRVDESPVSEVTRHEIYADEVKMVTQRYPFAGESNVRLQLGVVSLASGEVTWIDLGSDTDIYIPRVRWTENADLLSYQWMSRDQKSLELRVVDLARDEQRVLLTETSDTWLNLHNDLEFLANDAGFLWASERDGFKHIYRYSLNGDLLGQLTSGPWMIDAIEAVTDNDVFFTGRKDSARQVQLYRVPIVGGTIERISRRVGTHDVEFSVNGERYVDTFSSAKQLPQVSLHDASGELGQWIYENVVDEAHPIAPYWDDLPEPEFGVLPAEDGTELYYRMDKPTSFDATKHYPVLVLVYGGPHAQLVRDRWSGLLRPYLAQQGYVVFTVDNRGSWGRGKAFEDPIYRAMGGPEVRDQIAGVEYLKTQPWVDPDRIGIFGYSYGGYMTLLAMFKAPEHFSAGFAGGAVVDWSLYDTFYTERYMGKPQDEESAYAASSPMQYYKQLESPLLIAHGMADDNVLFKHATTLYKALQDAAIPFWSMDYPGQKHGNRGTAAQIHYARTLQNFFDLHLGAAAR